MNKIIAIQSDNIKKTNIKTDTTVLLAKEAQERGYRIIWYETKDLNFINLATRQTFNFLQVHFLCCITTNGILTFGVKFNRDSSHGP